MSLRYPVKINRVNNLSDARYCAGMGVEILGISNEVTVQEYMAITGWITGVDISLDIYKTDEAVFEIIETLKPSYIETSSLEVLSKLKETGVKVIYRVEAQDYDSIREKCVLASTYATHISVSNTQLSDEQLISLCTQFSIILNVDGYSTPQIEDLCSKIVPAYIALNGGHEMAPGLKSFDEMAEVLEYLESTED